MNQITCAWVRFLATISAMTAALVIVALLPQGGRCLIHIKADGNIFSALLPQADRHRPNRSEICALLRRCAWNVYQKRSRPHTRRALVEVRS
jgi:hypothetical protein